VMPTKGHEYWMRIALQEAEGARMAGELPIGGVLVAGGQELCRKQTSVRRRGSMAAHGELLALLEVRDNLYAVARPLVLYTTLEPCLMCLGAMMQCDVDQLVYGMRCAPDGGTRLMQALDAHGWRRPEVLGGVLERDCVEAMRRWQQPADHPAQGYLRAILEPYG